MKKLLVIVDMLNGFCHPAGSLYCGDASRRIIPLIRDKIEEYNAEGGDVVFLADNHNPDDPEFRRFPPHCLRGSWETEIVEELKGKAKRSKLIPKTRFSGFYDTPLEEYLEELQPELVEVVGVCTNICVLYTVADLRNRDYNVRVHKDCVASFDAEAHDFALKQMDTVLGAEIV